MPRFLNFAAPKEPFGWIKQHEQKSKKDKFNFWLIFLSIAMIACFKKI